MWTPLFVVAPPRSGTTLTMHLLGAHPEIAVTRESCWIPVLRRMHLLATTPSLAPISDGHSFDTIGVIPGEYVDQVAGAFESLMPRFVEDLFARFGESGVRFFGDKLTGVPDVEFACRAFPTGRFILLTRDPRDALVSSFAFQETQDTAWSHIPIQTRLLFLRTFIDEVTVHLDRVVHTRVRYEDLVRDPEGTLEPVFAFLGLTVTPEVTSWILDGAPALFARHGTSRTVTDTIGRWRRELTEEQQRHLEAELGPTLDRWGYS